MLILGTARPELMFGTARAGAGFLGVAVASVLESDGLAPALESVGEEVEEAGDFESAGEAGPIHVHAKK